MNMDLKFNTQPHNTVMVSLWVSRKVLAVHCWADLQHGRLCIYADIIQPSAYLPATLAHLNYRQFWCHGWPQWNRKYSIVPWFVMSSHCRKWNMAASSLFVLLNNSHNPAVFWALCSNVKIKIANSNTQSEWFVSLSTYLQLWQLNIHTDSLMPCRDFSEPRKKALTLTH